MPSIGEVPTIWVRLDHEANGTDGCVPPPRHSGAKDFSLTAHVYAAGSKNQIDSASAFEVAFYQSLCSMLS